MIKLTVNELLQCLDGFILNRNEFTDLNLSKDFLIEQIYLDSRSVTANSLFVAIKGEQHDGHDYLQEACSNGARLAIVARKIPNTAVPQLVVNDPSLALGTITKHLDNQWSKKKVAITGSSGKTTTKFMLQSILVLKGDVLCAQSSYNNNIGLPLTMFNAKNEQWAGIFEIGTNHPGEINYLTNLIKSDIAILTNISKAHIGNFAGLEDIALEKSTIFNGLRKNGIAIIPYDSEYKDFLINKIQDKNQNNGSQVNIITFGLDGHADIYASNIKGSAINTSFTLNYRNQNIEITLSLLGKHQISNALAAAAAALNLGISLAEVKQGLENLKPVYKRMQPSELSNNLTLIDDSYNANPKSVSAALEFLSELPGQKIFVLGDMKELGELTKFEHEQIGRLARSLKIDKLYAFGKHASLAQNIFDDAFNNYQNKFADKEELVNTLIEHISDEHNLGNFNHCTVLIKGSNSTKMWEVGEKLKFRFNTNKDK